LQEIITEISGLRREIENQKELINKRIQSYPSEKELLEEFVKIYVEFKKLKNKEVYDKDELSKLEKKYDDISDEIKLKRSVIKKIEEECDKLVQLEENISEFREQSKQMVNVMINNSSISVQEGHVFLGNIIGDQTNFSYNNVEEHQTLAQILLKGK
jgi:predicted nuclease with TOPRIM domain